MQKMSISEYRKLPVSYPSRSKYGNKKTVYDGITYDSKKEAAYAQQLDLRLRAGEFRSWERQIPFKIHVEGIHICTYIADFRINHFNGGEEIIDVKGVKTDVYKLKKKLVQALYKIKIIEV